MSINLILDGKTKTVSTEELFQLAADGIIQPDTPVSVSGKLVPAGDIQGIIFFKSTVIPPPVPPPIQLTPSTRQNKTHATLLIVIAAVLVTTIVAFLVASLQTTSPNNQQPAPAVAKAVVLIDEPVEIPVPEPNEEPIPPVDDPKEETEETQNEPEPAVEDEPELMDTPIDEEPTPSEIAVQPIENAAPMVVSLEPIEATELRQQFEDAVEQAKALYRKELEKELALAKRQGELQHVLALEAELKHHNSEYGTKLTAFTPDKRTLLNVKTRYRNQLERVRDDYRKKLDSLVRELVRSERIDEAKIVQNLADLSEPPRHLGQPGKRIPKDNPFAQQTVDMNDVLSQGVLPAIPKRQFVGHTEGVVVTDWSPDGTKIVSADNAGQTNLWDARSGEKMMSLKFGKGVHGVAFTPSGKQILVASHNKTTLWDIVSNTKQWEVDYGEHNHFVKINPDGKICCIGDYGRRGFILRRMEYGSMVHRFDNIGIETVGGDFDSKGNRIVVAWGPDARIFDVKTGQLLIELKNGHSEVIRNCVFSPDDKMVLTGSADDSVVFWNAQTGKPIRRFINFGHDVLGLAFSNDGTKLAVARNGIGTVILSTKTWEPICVTPFSGWWCGQQVAWSPDDKEIVTVRDDAIVSIWEIPSDEEVARFRAARWQSLNLPTAKLKTELSSHSGSWCSFGQFTPDSQKFIAVSHSEKGCNVFDITTGKPIAKLSYPHFPLCRTDIHPNGEIVATGAWDGKILLWNIGNGNIIREINAHEGHIIEGMKFSLDGSFLASGSQDKTAAIWDTKTGKELMRFNGHTAAIWQVDISSDGKLLATSANDGGVRLWDIKTGKELYCLNGHSHNDIRGLAFNHQGTVLASGAFDHTVVLWDVETGKQIKRLVGSESAIASVNFSPDDSQLVLGCTHSSFSSVWDIETGMPLYRVALPSHRGKGWDHTAQFSPDGKTIATCSFDPIRIWNVPTDEELQQWSESLEKERATARTIPLIKMPMERAQAGSGTWGFDTFITVSGQKFENSLWAHPQSKYVFRLDKKWNKFTTHYGLEKGADLNVANCIFIVQGDGKELFRSKAIQDYIAHPLELNVQNIGKLELIVDPNGPYEWDHGTWLTPTLSR